VEHCFLATAPQPARLLLARGCDDIRCYVKHRPSPQPSGASPAKAPALAIRGWQVDAERAGSRESAARRPP
jgi:hypothetical protein